MSTKFHGAHGFDVMPAIDLLDGQSVRLVQGKRSSAHIVHTDPLEQIASYVQAGADWVHLVNLNAAFGDDPETHLGARASEEMISQLVSGRTVKIQMGGGIRSAEALRRALDLGVRRVVVGTWACSHFDEVMQWVSRFPEQIVIGVDSLDGRVAIRGWTESTGETTIEFAKRLKAAGVLRVLFTDVSRDGMMAGAAVEATARLAAESQLSVIASGGVRSAEDLRALSQCTGVCGVVTGQALAAGTLSLSEAISFQRKD